MSAEAKLEVSIPLPVATSRLVNKQFLTHVRRLMRHLGGHKISGSSEEDRRNSSFFVEAFFPDRQNALGAAIAIRALSLGHSGTSAKDFWYTIDDDEMLLFKKSGDLYAFESKSFTEILEEKLGDKVSEAFSSSVGF